MNTSTANTSTGSLTVKPASGRVSNRGAGPQLERALAPQDSPMAYVVRAANVLRGLCRVGNAGHRLICAEKAPIDAARAGLKRSAVKARHWELEQSANTYRTYRTRRAA